MSSALKILAYFLGTLFLGALLAPPLYQVGQTVGAHVHAARWLRDTVFQRYFDRAMFLAALLLLWPAVRSLNIGSWRDLGLRPDRCPVRHLLLGFLAAGGLLWAMGGGLWWWGIYAPRVPAPWSVLGGIGLTAAFVALIEEGFFRGALLGLVWRGAGPWPGVLFVAAVFAVLHFLKPEEDVVSHQAVNWLSGFVLLPHSFWQFGEPLLLLGGFTTLFCVGVILGGARLLTGSLWLPVGLHAGWIFGLRSFAKFSRHVEPPSIWFGGTLLVGLGSVGMVLLTGLVTWLVLRRERTDAGGKLLPSVEPVR